MLAERIRSGPPRDEEPGTTPAVRTEPAPPTPTPPHEKPVPREPVMPEPHEPLSRVEIVHLKPTPVRRPDLRIYVRGEDGRLKRLQP